MAKEIPVVGPEGQLFTMLVDDEDYELMSKISWGTKKQPNGKLRPQAIVRPHKLVVDYNLVDHINNDPWDNRKSNLRPATNQQNQANRGIQVNNTTGFKGVVYTHNRYDARITVHGKRIYLGYFKNPIDAAKAYDKAAREHFGEFAYCNFPVEGGDA